MEYQESNNQIKTMETITNFIDHFYLLHVRDKYFVLKDNWDIFEHWNNELGKLPQSPPNFNYPIGPQLLEYKYQSWLKWARTNFECMKELRGKMIIAKTFIDFLKANKAK